MIKNFLKRKLLAPTALAVGFLALNPTGCGNVDPVPYYHQAPLWARYAADISGAQVVWHGDNYNQYPYEYWSNYRSNQDVQNCLAYVNGHYPSVPVNGTMAAACGSGQTPGVGWPMPVA